MKFEMAINLKTPRSLGLKDVSTPVPNSVTYVGGYARGDS